jgi:uracil-DNA glycosylase
MIVAMQLDVSQVYITNIIKCRPPQNRNPSTTEITACNNYLMSQIALVKPVIIITLGRFAAQTLLNTETAIGKLRGQVHKYHTSTATIPLIVSYHPAYLLRMPSAKAAAWQDLQLALSTFSRL